MDYKNKYLKYKNKYIALKSNVFNNILIKSYNNKPELVQIGGVLPCNKDLFFHNNFGTCWNISIDMIFLFGHLTQDIVQTNLLGYSNMDTVIAKIATIDNTLIQCLPVTFFTDFNYMNTLDEDYKESIDIIFTNLKERLENKDQLSRRKTDSKTKLIRQKSRECEKNIGQTFYKLQIKSSDGTYGATEKEQFIFILLMSIFLYQRKVDVISINDPRYNYTTFFKDTNQIIGIIIHFYHHASCLYTCKSMGKELEYFYYNDNLQTLIAFNWPLFFKELNSIKEYKIVSLKETAGTNYGGSKVLKKYNIVTSNPFIIDLTDEKKPSIVWIHKKKDNRSISIRIIITLKDYNEIMEGISTDESLFREIIDITFLTPTIVPPIEETLPVLTPTITPIVTPTIVPPIEKTLPVLTPIVTPTIVPSTDIVVPSTDIVLFRNFHIQYYISYYIKYLCNEDISKETKDKLCIILVQLPEIIKNRDLFNSEIENNIQSLIKYMIKYISNKMIITNNGNTVLLLLSIPNLELKKGDKLLYNATKYKFYPIIKKVLLLFPNIEKYKVKDSDNLVLDYMIEKNDVNTNDILAEYAIRNNNTNLVKRLLLKSIDSTTKTNLEKYIETTFTLKLSPLITDLSHS